MLKNSVQTAHKDLNPWKLTLLSKLAVVWREVGMFGHSAAVLTLLHGIYHDEASHSQTQHDVLYHWWNTVNAALLSSLSDSASSSLSLIFTCWNETSSSAGMEYSQPGSRFEYISCRYPGLWAAAELWYFNPKTTQSPTVDTSGGKCWEAPLISEELIVCWGGGHAGDVTALIWALKHFLWVLHLFIMRSWNKHCWWTRQCHENTTHLAALKSMTPPIQHTEWYQALSV